MNAWYSGLMKRSRLFEGLRKVRVKLSGVGVLILVGLFDYYASRHLAYGQLSMGLWVGFGIMGLLSIGVTFFGLIVAGILLVS
jgi:hypothetical protein